jgi:hypothetical protein
VDANVLIRGLVLVAGLLLTVLGFGLIAVGAEAALSGLWLVVMGGVLLIAGVLERTRYRSEAAERAMDPAGPGGGETAGEVEPRFRPTDEVFVDPTSQRRMRVLLDVRSGERRYVAED